jgi:hypothetical protein
LFKVLRLDYPVVMRLLILLSALLMALPAAAREVYKWVNEEGVIIYSDTYQPGAESIKVDDARVGRAGGAASSQPGPGAAADEAPAGDSGYEEFVIAQPENDETIRSNEGIVTVGLTLSPTLMDGHGIQVYVDGSRIGEASLTSTQFTLNALNRGTHSLQAKVVDESGATLISTDTISFHLRKASINKP